MRGAVTFGERDSLALARDARARRAFLLGRSLGLSEAPAAHGTSSAHEAFVLCALAAMLVAMLIAFA
jgi:hypothetical protein